MEELGIKNTKGLELGTIIYVILDNKLRKLYIKKIIETEELDSIKKPGLKYVDLDYFNEECMTKVRFRTYVLNDRYTTSKGNDVRFTDKDINVTVFTSKEILIESLLNE